MAACGPDSTHGRVEGKLEGINQADILVYVEDSVSGDPGRVDTITIKRGKFSYDREVHKPAIVTFLYPNFSTTTFVMHPGGTVKLKGDANRLSEIEVDGNEDNLLLTEFRQHTNGKADVEVRREAATFIRSHAASQAAIVLFREYFANVEKIEQNPTESLLKELVKAQPKHPVVLSMEQRLSPLLKCLPGAKLQDFTSTDTDGKTIKSTDYKGKPLLIVFCAQWDGGFYQMKRKARDLRDQIPSDRLAMLFISLDGDKENIIRANSYDPLPGKILFDGKSLQSPLVRTLGMRYVNGNLLVGRDGKIIARDIPVDQWTDRIQALL